MTTLELGMVPDIVICYFVVYFLPVSKVHCGNLARDVPITIRSVAGSPVDMLYFRP